MIDLKTIEDAQKLIGQQVWYELRQGDTIMPADDIIVSIGIGLAIIVQTHLGGHDIDICYLTRQACYDGILARMDREHAERKEKIMAEIVAMGEEVTNVE